MEDEPAYHITIAHVDGDEFQHEAVVTGAIEATLQRHHIRSATIHVAMVNDQRIAELNQTHLNHEGPTDVLAFDLRDDHHATVGDDLEGEIVISTDTAKRESQLLGHALEAELSLYAVHATLHLLGYTDHDPASAEKMHTMEDEILTAVGLGPVYRSETE